ncbi:hypothetical protein BOTBODRAFT_173815 [Botryobasidium botryosum FD-172 SS1]|uniref:Diaminopimelate epimerase-like protein n=1 Tax=Botryobasidium botryosum (strain FD-172 SS1) TaxID=930990 RepID=A0A067MIZ4_BOTB1|nr:hypothetical protein BOTBODRAFT_173815 [Botryobasidium botryosum FD-172 SS1]
MLSSSALTYTIVDAFTSTPFKGNPAAVLIHPRGSLVPPDNTLKSIARELNAPISVFITHMDTSEDLIPTFGIRWILPTGIEAVLCGHGTLAAAQVMFADPSVVPAHHDTIRLSSTSGALLARRCGERVEMEFPAGETAPIADATLEERIKDVVWRAFGRTDDLYFKFVGRGKGLFEPLILVEIDGEKVELEDAAVDTQVFAELHPHRMIFITTSSPPSSRAQSHFRSRGFRIGIDLTEDQACGSAHCAMAPYWARKLPGFLPGTELRALQVGARTAEIGITFHEERGRANFEKQLDAIAY